MKRTLADAARTVGGSLIGVESVGGKAADGQFADGEPAGAKRVGVPDAVYAAVSSDSRTLGEGALFVALRGPNFDGTDFVAAAAARGAIAALVERQAPVALPQIVVPDALRALQTLAAAWRGEFDIPLVGVAGSNGKTTVKEMTAAILSRMGSCLATAGNLNNHIGVPLTLMRLTREHRSAVVEMGANRIGDVAELVALARPTVGLITNAGAEHLEFFGDLDGVAQGEGEMVAGLDAAATAVINADDAYADYWRRVAAADRIVTFCGPAAANGRSTQGGPKDSPSAEGRSAEGRPEEGPAADGLSGDRGSADGRPADRGSAEGRPPDRGRADFTARDVVLGIEGGDFATRFTLECPLGRREISLRAGGVHNVTNALAAAAAATAAGASLEDVVLGLADFRSVAGRLQLKSGVQGTWIIDDSYNANPGSVRAGLEVLRSLPGATWLVLGDMAELGDAGADSHADMGREARACGVARLFTVGTLAERAAEAFGAGAEWFVDVDELILRLQSEAAPGVTMLIKGSRVNRLERVVRALAGGGG